MKQKHSAFTLAEVLITLGIVGVVAVGCAHLRTAKKRVAFTLAEVLITLGIIGVVAALTLPALLTNIQSRVRGNNPEVSSISFH